MSNKLFTAVILLALAQQADAYVLRKDSTGATVQWKQAVTFVLDTETAKKLGDGALAAIQASASQIALAADVGVTVKTGATHGVGFSESGANENAIVLLKDWPFSHSAIASTVITVDAVSHQILDADVALNGSSHRFGVMGGGEEGEEAPDDQPTDDVENTTSHELGHAMGLQHNPDDPKVVMFPTANPGETSKRDLQADDKAGLVALYPPGSAASSVPHGCSSAPGPFAAAMVLLLVLVARRKPAPVPVRIRRTPKLAIAAVLATAGAARAAEPLHPVEQVAEGKVVQVRTLEPKAGERLLFTEVTLQLSKCHGKQTACDGALKFTVPGGKWGRYEQAVTDQPVPVEGEPLAVALSQKVERVFHLEQPADKAALQKTLTQFKEESWPK
ncbi:MAG: matrixin family metalloprotease [Myxococcaceae bacterium]